MCKLAKTKLGVTQDNSEEMRIEVQRGLEGIKQISEAWDDLFSKSVTAPVEMSRPWTQALVREDASPELNLFLCLWDDSRLAALLPLRLHKVCGLCVAECIGESFKGYLGVLLDRSYPKAVEHLSSWITDNAPFQALVLRNIASNDIDTTRLFEALVVQGWQVRRCKRTTFWQIRLEQSLSLFLDMHKSSKSRRSLRKKELALKRAHVVELDHYVGKEITPGVIGRLVDMSRNSWKYERGIDHLCELFCQRLLSDLAAAGLARVWIIRLNGNDIAYRAGAVTGSVLNLKWTAYKTSFSGSIPFGPVLFMRIIEDCCQEGLSLIDLGHGHLEHKRFWGTEEHIVNRIAIGRGIIGRMVVYGMSALWSGRKSIGSIRALLRKNADKR